MAAVSRRNYLRFLGVAGAGLSGLVSAAPAVAAPTHAHNVSVVRLMSVVSPVDGGLLPDLIADYERRTGQRIALSTAEDVYGPARTGAADLVLSHYGHDEVDSFVQGGYGRWPRLVFSNQLALLGSPDDPALVRGASDLVDAFSRIAQAGAPYIVNDTEGIRYLGEILWNAAGKPLRQGWFIDNGLRQTAAMGLAAQMRGYTMWGLTPFLKSQLEEPVELEPLVLHDPLLQRLMVTVVVNAQRVAGVNEPGATAFQQHLLAPATQARIRAVRVPGIDQQIWWPAGRSNQTNNLPR